MVSSRGTHKQTVDRDIFSFHPKYKQAKMVSLFCITAMTDELCKHKATEEINENNRLWGVTTLSQEIRAISPRY